MAWLEALPSSWQLSPEAIIYLATLGAEQAPGLALSIAVHNPLTAGAQLDIAFQPLDENLLCYCLTPKMALQTQSKFLEALEGLTISLNESDLGQSELEVLAPSLYGADQQKPLIEQIRVFFNQEIAPVLAGHKGGATLERLSENGVLTIRFFGGCQGCSLSSVTLKSTIREKLQQRFSAIKEIYDVTAHAHGENPYA